MTTKKPKTGGEIDAYCTKCKLDLGHRIIAMVDGVPKKVECLTCKSHHLYRKPKSEPTPAAAKKGVVKRGDAPPPSVSAKAPKSERLTAAMRAERERTAIWEHAIAGKPATAFRGYRVDQSFTPGELVRHVKFGDGVVVRVLDRNKVEVLFQDGPRVMAMAQ